MKKHHSKRFNSSYFIALTFVCFQLFALKVIAFSNTNPDENKANPVTIESKILKVTIDPSFPRIMQYNWLATGDLLYGHEDKLSQVLINGRAHTPEVSFKKTNNSAQYVLNFSEINIVLDIQIKVTGNVVEFNVVRITENGSFKLSTLEIPDHNLISVRSSQSGAEFSGAKMYTAMKGSGDVFIPLTEDMTTDSIPKGYLYGIINTVKLAASIWTNSVTEKSDDSRIQKQTVRNHGYSRTGIWSGSWIYRAQGMKSVDPLPVVKIVITNDVNNDYKVDWQDGAVAFRSIMNNPLGSDKIPDLVVQRIPMNFASQATNPFTKTLDETKRVYLNTDGLGQFVILKGYGSEGHDSGHPDYGDIGKRQGGAADMEMLCKAAQKYNAFMGVHINGTESYPEAKAFDDSLVDKTKPGWDWLDASYRIDKRHEATSNNRMLRLKSLKDQAPSLNFIYCDVWYAKGSWDSKKLGREIHSLGLTLATEFPMDHETDAVWNHWAVDYDYGGEDIKGFNSTIVRFIRNHQKDTWIARHPLLGGAEMKDFEGWQGRNNFDSCILTTFQTDLPTKYLQHFPILKWDENAIAFEKNISVSNVSGKRTIMKDGRLILDGGTYLLPWNPFTEDKLYHWNEKTGSTTWNLPASWSKCKTVQLYQLSDQGRKFIRELKVLNGQITLLAVANTPYVVYKKQAENVAGMNWGESTKLKDPGFNSGNLDIWNVEGGGATIVRNKNAQYEMVMDKGGVVKVSQALAGLEPGNWYASVYVSTAGNRKASLGISNYGGPDVNTYCNSSLWGNYIAADSKSGSTMQRMYAFFAIPEGQTTATLYLGADSGSTKVTFDDVRVARMQRTLKPDSLYFSEDFENIPDGLSPFVKGPAGGVNDPRTHLSELHAPYTQKGWNGKLIDDVINGKWSLKAHGEATGLLLQTIPQTLRFKEGKTYTVSFKYEASGADYALIAGDGTNTKFSIVLNDSNVPTLATFTFTGSETGNSWFGIEKLREKETDFVMDDLIIMER